jgi:uncharacterized membrane protein (DUF4010 family)
MLISGLGITFFLQRKNTPSTSDLEYPVKLTHPLKLSTAIKFGLIFAVVLIVLEFAQEAFGSVGVYFASATAGLVNMNAVALSVAQISSQAQLDIQVAGIAIVIAALMNTISKVTIVFFTGSSELRRTVIRSFVVILLAGLFSGLFIFWLG